MESQDEENSMVSSSSTFPIEDESQRPTQANKVIGTKNKKLTFKAQHFRLLMINGVFFGDC